MENQNLKLGFVSTYPPRACGIATFTQDLVHEMEKLHGVGQAAVVAVSNEKLSYSPRVRMEIEQGARRSYIKAACRLKQSDLDAVILEHEYGIFGGRDGEYILDFAKNLKKPLVTTLHTVLAEPSENQRRILQVLSRQSHAIVTMAQSSRKLLEDVYRIPANKIQVIPHGVPSLPTSGTKEELKYGAGLTGRIVLSTFGLLSPGKGIEYAIRAVAIVAETYPEILYLVLGKTHPCVKQIYGEAYREKLKALVSALGVERQIRFVDRYLTKKEIADYLSLSDIYITPYLGREQAVSGTLAYAAGYGKAIISTPYNYAKEMLAQGRGLLAGFADADSLAKCILLLLQNPAKKAGMEKLTQALGRTMQWEQVARKYVRIFNRLQEESKEDMAG